MSTFASPFERAGLFYAPEGNGKSVKKLIEKTERKVQASTGIVTKVVILKIQSSVDS